MVRLSFHTVTMRNTSSLAVLVDSEKRAIYDVVGTRALDLNWDVARQLFTPNQVREEYERLRRQRQINEMLERAHPTVRSVLREEMVASASLFAGHLHDSSQCDRTVQARVGATAVRRLRCHRGGSRG